VHLLAEHSCQISTSGIAIISMLHGRQSRRIGSFSAVDGLVV